MIIKIFKNIILLCAIVMCFASCDRKEVSEKEEKTIKDIVTQKPEIKNTKSNYEISKDIKTKAKTNKYVNSADMKLVEQLAIQFEKSYKTGYKIKSETLDTIILARLLRKNKELSVDDKIKLIKSRKPSSMASKGAELALYLSELKRKDMTLEERARLLRNISSIYAQFYHPDKGIEYMKKVVDIYEKLGRKSDVAFAYECMADIYYNDKNDFNTALSFYEKALETARNVENYDHEWTQETILTIYAQQGNRGKVKELYEKYSQVYPQAFDGIKLFLKYPGSKVNEMRCTIDISGDPSEICGLPELQQRENFIEIQSFLNKVLMKMLIVEYK